MRVFHLPDLGEGLPDAEIVEWLVAEGDAVTLDQPMVSMETAKAVVEVPAPFTGQIVQLHGQPGDVIDTGAPLVSFDGEDKDSTQAPPTAATPAVDAKEDSGTVVGQVESGGGTLVERVTDIGGGHKATPAVRALAKKLQVDLARITPTGSGGVITAGDVKLAAAAGTASATTHDAANRHPEAKPQRQEPLTPTPPGEWVAIRGTRRTMARAMADAHAQVVPTTITDDADVGLWEGRQDMTVRMIRALVAGCRREPHLNAWFKADGPERQVHPHVNVGIAVDTPDGLFVSTLRDADRKTAGQLREDINRLRHNVENRSIPPQDLTGYTIMLSNVGVYAGLYTTPIVTPPCVAILATGKMRSRVVASHGGIAVHPVIPLSLTFDHRAVTGGEAARFLAAYIEDIARQD